MPYFLLTLKRLLLFTRVLSKFLLYLKFLLYYFLVLLMNWRKKSNKLNKNIWPLVEMPIRLSSVYYSKLFYYKN